MVQIDPKIAILGVQNGVLGPSREALWRTSKDGGQRLEACLARDATLRVLLRNLSVDIPEALLRG